MSNKEKCHHHWDTPYVPLGCRNPYIENGKNSIRCHEVCELCGEERVAIYDKDGHLLEVE